MTATELITTVTEALTSIGGHRLVPFEILRVEIWHATIRVEMTLHYRRSNRVCCGEPGCCIEFLGTKRRQVPGAFASRLNLAAEPAVLMLVRLQHENGYEYIDLRTGESAGLGRDYTAEYDESHFR